LAVGGQRQRGNELFAICNLVCNWLLVFAVSVAAPSFGFWFSFCFGFWHSVAYSVFRVLLLVACLLFVTFGIWLIIWHLAFGATTEKSAHPKTYEIR
jgi:hypothetical protein